MANPRPAFGSNPHSNPPPEGQGAGAGRGAESGGRTNSNFSNDDNESTDDREAMALLQMPDPALTSYLYDWSRKLFRVPQAGYEPYRWVNQSNNYNTLQSSNFLEHAPSQTPSTTSLALQLTHHLPPPLTNTLDLSTVHCPLPCSDPLSAEGRSRLPIHPLTPFHTPSLPPSLTHQLTHPRTPPLMLSHSYSTRYPAAIL